MKNMSIRWKFILPIAFAIISSAIFSILVFRYSYEILYDAAKIQAKQSLEKVQKDVEQLISIIDTITIPYLYNEEVHKILTDNNNTDEINKTLQENFANTINTYLKYQDYAFDISILNKNMHIISSSEPDWIGGLRSLGTSWVSKIVTTPSMKTLTISGYYVFRETEGSSSKVIGITRSIYDNNNAFIGAILCEIDISVLQQICDQFLIGKSGFISLVNKDGYMLFNTKLMKIGNQLNLSIENTTNYNELHYYSNTLYNEPFYIMYLPFQYSDLAAVAIIPETQIVSNLMIIQNLTYYFIIAIVIILIGIIIYISRGILKPILNLRYQMENMGNGIFPSYQNSNRNDEIGQLQNGFITMSSRLNELIESEYKSRLREKEAQLNALQARINPHFLYNTLERISMTALLNNDMQVVNQLEALGDIMRSTIEQEEWITTLEKEIQYIKSYLFLLSIGDADRLNIEWKIDESLLQCKTNKLVLQPIIENSIKHGFKNMTSGCHIRIAVFQSLNTVIITIDDNGCGMDADFIEKYNLSFSLESSDTSFMKKTGLSNVNNRLKIYYGNDFGIKLENIPSGGLRVIITIPLIL